MKEKCKKKRLPARGLVVDDVEGVHPLISLFAFGDAAKPAHAAELQRLDYATLVASGVNDGDSFQILHNSKTGGSLHSVPLFPPFDMSAPDEYHLPRLRLEDSKKYGSMHDPLEGANYGKTH